MPFNKKSGAQLETLLLIHPEIIKCLILLLWRKVDNERLTDGESGIWKAAKKRAEK